jgi:benzaldehyde dehydrogenase (NAD)
MSTTVTPTLLLERSDWSERLCSGGWIESTGGTREVIDKASGETLGTVGWASAEDVTAAAGRAAEAQPAWAATPGRERAEIVRRFARLVDEHAKELGEWLVRETGSTQAKAVFELDLTREETYAAAEIATAPQGLYLPTAAGRTSFVRRIPFGVVGIITPWNSPLILTARALGPALAAGNAVLLKPAPDTPVIGGVLLVELWREAGLPDGVLHMLPGDVETGEAIVTDPRVQMVSFTGSTAAGRRVAALAGEGSSVSRSSSAATTRW